MARRSRKMFRRATSVSDSRGNWQTTSSLSPINTSPAAATTNPFALVSLTPTLSSPGTAPVGVVEVSQIQGDLYLAPSSGSNGIHIVAVGVAIVSVDQAGTPTARRIDSGNAKDMADDTWLFLHTLATETTNFVAGASTLTSLVRLPINWAGRVQIGEGEGLVLYVGALVAGATLVGHLRWRQRRVEILLRRNR